MCHGRCPVRTLKLLLSKIKETFIEICCVNSLVETNCSLNKEMVLVIFILDFREAKNHEANDVQDLLDMLSVRNSVLC